MNKYRVSVVQLGSRMHYAVPKIFNNTDQLEYFYTDITSAKGWLRCLKYIPKSLSIGLVGRLKERRDDEVPINKIISFTIFGFKYAFLRANARTQTDLTQVFLWAGSTFCNLVLKFGLGGSNCIYVYNSAGLELLKFAKKRQILGILEQTIAPYQTERRILEFENSAFPGWQIIKENDTYADTFSRREFDEWKCADIIICGSNFVKKSIIDCGGPSDKCLVIPYGVNMKTYKPRKIKPNKRLNILTVGEVGLRKGSQYVLESAKLLSKEMNFRMVGHINVLPEIEKKIRKYIDLTGVVARSKIIDHFEWADVFLLPSICEGSATVVYEAIAHGLPVICTENTGSVISNNIEGFIIPIRDVSAIVQSLNLLTNNPDLYNSMSINSCQLSHLHTVELYGERLKDAINKFPLNDKSIKGITEFG